MICAFCREKIEVGDRVSRNDMCPMCGVPLHSCKQCKFYDPHSYNECREVSAERIVDKERANFCDYFVPRGSPKKNVNRAQEAREALEALFKK